MRTRLFSKRTWLLIAIICAVVTSRGAAEVPNPVVLVPDLEPAHIAASLPSDFFRVVKVVDGDTFDVDIRGTSTRIRLIGVDTPEVVDPRKPVQCFGREASDKAKALLANQVVRLESDSTQGDKDKYGRILRYVFLTDGTSFNKMMIEEGYAHEYTYKTPYKYQTEFKAAQTEAQREARGLWGQGVCASP